MVSTPILPLLRCQKHRFPVLPLLKLIINVDIDLLTVLAQAVLDRGRLASRGSTCIVPNGTPNPCTA